MTKTSALRALALGAALALQALEPAAANAAPPEPSVAIPALPASVQRGKELRRVAERADTEVRRRYDAGDFSGALEAADEAYAVWPNSYTALVRALVLARLDRRGEAFAALLVASDLDPTADELTMIDRGLSRHGEALRPKMGWLKLSVSAGSPTATVAGREIQPPRTIGLSEGEHALSLSAPGFEGVEAKVRILSGRATVARYELAPERKAPLAETPPPKQEAGAGLPDPDGEGPARRSVLPWVLVGGGAALGLSGVAATVWAGSAADDAERYSGKVSGMGEEERRRRYNEADSAVQTRSAVSYVLYGAGAAAVGAGVAWLLLSDGAGEPASVVLPFVGPDRLGIGLAASF